MNIGSFDNGTQIYHSNTRLVRYSHGYLIKKSFSDEDEDDEGGSPYDDEFQELEEAVYRYPMGDPDHDDIDLVNQFFLILASNQSAFLF